MLDGTPKGNCRRCGCKGYSVHGAGDMEEFRKHLGRMYATFFGREKQLKMACRSRLLRKIAGSGRIIER
jgi:hypothetical protein